MIFPHFNCYFLSTSQEIGWEEHLWCELFSVECDAKRQLSHSDYEHDGKWADE